ncbi:DUF1648 domain-containing protein [Gordonia phthalatica]|uniref:DUF1648 domain-containing protein n=1 Tax=Gordonia phthalatica TaxID=1136941 RepID=A0A0N9NAL8_9ACTN|nr:DUF1648 domain-containing protein [Gordonia phthalatica]ALG85401.1 hypothetical protein ACH46_14100 [Gordonia phthalatica]
MNTTDRRPPEDSTRRIVAYVGVGLVVPLISVLASVIAQVIAWPRLPDRIAVHWNASGEANNFGSPWIPLVMTVVIGLGLPALIVAPNLHPLRSGARGPSFRLVAAIAAATAAGVSYLLAASVVTQTDGQAARPGMMILVMIAVAAVVGVLGWLVIPKDLPRETRAADPLRLGRGEKVVWIGTETISRWFAGIAIAALIFSGVFVVGAAIGGTGGLVSAIVIVIAVVLVIATSVAFHVRIDADGLSVRSILGVPRFHVPADDIERVDVIEIRAIGDFGGYGIRMRGGALGVILRSGPAVEVTRRSNGRRFVVTIGDAGTAAAALATVATAQA